MNTKVVPFCPEGDNSKENQKKAEKNNSLEREKGKELLYMKWTEFFEVTARESTAHGVKYMARTSNSMRTRALWLVLWICLVITFLTLSMRNLLMFTSKPTSTVVNIRADEALTFPAVTLCNLNQFRRSVVGGDDKTKEILKSLFTVNKTAIDFYDEELMIKYDFYNRYPLPLVEKAAHLFEEQFMECYFNSQEIICEDYFSQIITPLGFCYTFNSLEFIKREGKAIQATRTGSSSGLRLRLNVQQDEYFTGPSESAGFKVLLHPYKTYPLIDELGFVVSPGFDVHVPIHMEKVITLPSPYKPGKCFDLTTTGNPLRYHDTYSKQACRVECLANYTIQHCGCRFYLQKAPDVPLCNLVEIATCYFPSVASYQKEAKIETEVCRCHETCRVEYFKPSISYGFFPSTYVIGQLESHYNASKYFIRENLLDLKIYYEEMNYVQTSQVPSYNSNAFISTIGGHLGLLLGASIITMGEFLSLFLAICHRCVFRIKNKLPFLGEI